MVMTYVNERPAARSRAGALDEPLDRHLAHLVVHPKSACVGHGQESDEWPEILRDRCA